MAATTQATSPVAEAIAAFFHQIPFYIAAVLVMCGFWFVAKLAAAIATRAVHSRLQYSTNHDELLLVVNRTAFFGTLLLGFIIAMRVAGLLEGMGFVLTALVAGIGFALQGVLGNFFAGVAIALQNKIHLGDVIKIDTLMGKITYIGARSTTVQSFDGYDIIVPNMDLISKQVSVFTSNENRRVTLTIGIEYAADAKKARDVMTQLLKSGTIAGVLQDQPIAVLMSDMAESSVNFSVKFWINQKKTPLVGVKASALQLLRDALLAEGIGIAFPQRTLHFATNDDKERFNNTMPPEVMAQLAGSLAALQTAPSLPTTASDEERERHAVAYNAEE